MCYNAFTIKINFFKYKRFKDGRCTYKTTGSSHLNKAMKQNKNNNNKKNPEKSRSKKLARLAKKLVRSTCSKSRVSLWKMVYWL